MAVVSQFRLFPLHISPLVQLLRTNWISPNQGQGAEPGACQGMYPSRADQRSLRACSVRSLGIAHRVSPPPRPMAEVFTT